MAWGVRVHFFDHCFGNGHRGRRACGGIERLLAALALRNYLQLIRHSILCALVVRRGSGYFSVGWMAVSPLYACNWHSSIVIISLSVRSILKIVLVRCVCGGLSTLSPSAAGKILPISRAPGSSNSTLLRGG